MNLRFKNVNKGSHMDALTIASGSTHADRRIAELKVVNKAACIRSIPSYQ